jgi:hypothetical protein
VLVMMIAVAFSRLRATSGAASGMI